ncbi:hypothetical protein BD309DRAFT_862433 [Dichomitus squalens]|uniref:Uncharacterized protein n=1 Tax=Dichomitus squalens TaxID=114155 RepID=A0A4Q9PNJ8_9APHY|nr:hypothetical protein BD309DRAFT_862433 [Dichomitus squalens]TBU55859.1 hypothetical protein BD310DRAFT_824932 [Dichomitus squalens]
MRAYASLYEEPTFEDPTAKEQSVVYAALGAAAVAVASTVAAFQMAGPPTWLTAAYVRTLTVFHPSFDLPDPSFSPLVPFLRPPWCLQAATDRCNMSLARRSCGLKCLNSSGTL